MGNQKTSGSEGYRFYTPPAEQNGYSIVKPKGGSLVKPKGQPIAGPHTAGRRQETPEVKDSGNISSSLEGEVQAKMENSFGQDFSGVRIHKDSDSAQDMNAKAYTQGTDIHFAPGAYHPDSKEGLELIGHELTHVVQQRQGRVGPEELHGKGLEINVDKNLEKEADLAGEKASKGEALNIRGQSFYSIQKEDNTKSQEISDWRKKGNLVGDVPVRNEYTVPDNNVVEQYREYNNLFQTVTDLQIAQDDRAKKLKGTGKQVADFNFWFAKVYSLVTKHILDYTKRSAFYYPSFVLRSTAYFESLYNTNWEASQQGGKVEEHWRKAFAASAKNKESYTQQSDIEKSAMEPDYFSDGSGNGAVILTAEAIKSMAVVDSLVQSMLAHIRFDLPRADAWVYNTYYKTQTPTLDTFMTDFMTMGGVFDLAGYEMQKIISQQGSALADMAPKSVQDMVMRYFFEADMTRERADTWQRAEELSKLPTDQIPANPIEQPIEQGKDGFKANMVPGKSYTSWLDKIPTKPSMNKTAPYAVTGASMVLEMEPKAIAALPLIQRIRLLAQMLSGVTANSSEDAILKILNATLQYQPGELVTLIDGVDPWELLLDLDFSKFTSMKQFLANHYYGVAPAVSIIRLLSSSVIALVTFDETWEGEVVLTALSIRADREAIVRKLLDYFSDEINAAQKDKSPLLRGLSLLADKVMANSSQVTRLYALFGISLSENSNNPITEEKNTSTVVALSTNEKQDGLHQKMQSTTNAGKNTEAANVLIVSGKQQPFSPLQGSPVSFEFTQEKLVQKVDAHTCLVEVKIILLKENTNIFIDEPLQLKATLKDNRWHIQFNIQYTTPDGKVNNFSAKDAALSAKFTNLIPK
ncbi:MAG TPA: DUF4157 domain-containing protein [Cytophagaceae bacterium]|jgi:hypothetical protein|nr:DUF4157 domain-containing protein [Cytophagaceae bacterium]